MEEAMRTHGLSVSELARASGVSRSTIQRMIAGDEVGTLYSWRAVARALGTTVSKLIGESNA